MTPIANDPARRIRRIQRWIVRSGTSDDSASTIDLTFDGPLCKKANPDRFIKRTCRANLLFKRELAWLAEYAIDLTTHLRREENNAALIAVDLANEEEVLRDVKSYASEEINRLKSELFSAEQSAKSNEFYWNIDRQDGIALRRDVAELRATIEQLRRRETVRP